MNSAELKHLGGVETVIARGRQEEEPDFFRQAAPGTHLYFGEEMPVTLQNAGLPASLCGSLVSRTVEETHFSFRAVSPTPTTALATWKYLLS